MKIVFSATAPVSLGAVSFWQLGGNVRTKSRPNSKTSAASKQEEKGTMYRKTTKYRFWLTAIAVLVFPNGLLDAQPGVGASARDLNPDGLRSGRTAGVAIDPRDPRRAYTVTQGGVFGSTDGGVTWAGNVNPDGTPGPFGNNLGNGLTNFIAIAPDPFNSGNVLLLVGDDNRTDAAKPKDGIWRSTDYGRTFFPVVTHPCPSPMRFLDGHIRFSKDRPGLVVASSVCGLAIISPDSGATWSFIEAPKTTGPRLIDGLDLFPAGGNFFGTPSTSDIVGFCRQFPDKSHREVGFYDVATAAWRFFDAPPAIWGGGDCSFAFDPRSSVHFFIAAATDRAHLFEGAWIGYDVVWNELNAPSDNNGRPVVVQVHTVRNTIRVYYHNTTTFYYADCGDLKASLFTCPASAGSWFKLNHQFSDSTEIAFDPSVPQSLACPMLLSGDGGNERSWDCGETWSFVSGIHTLLVDDAAFTGTGATRRIIMANFDTGYAIRDGTGAWGFVGADGWAADAIRTVPDEFVVSGGDDSPSASVVDLPFKERFKVPAPPKPWLGTGLGAHFAPRYYDAHELVIATISTKPDALQLWSLDTTAAFPAWTILSGALRPQAGTFAGVPNVGDLAVGGRLNGGGRNSRAFYVIAPSSMGNRLSCLSDGGLNVADATGLTNPIRVWASEGDSSWAYVYNYDDDPAKRGVYVTSPPKGRCAFVRDEVASDLLTRGTEFKGYDDPDGESNPTNPAIVPTTVPMFGVGFDPKRPQRAAIATAHNGILVTQDHGASWSVSHAFPEPNTHAVSIYFDDSGFPSTIEEAIVAGCGRGVWAIRFGAGGAHYIGTVGPGPAGDFTAKIQLVDETGAPVPGAKAYFTLQRVSSEIQYQPIEFQAATDANGIATIEQKAPLPPGAYTLTARFDRGAAFAEVWAGQQFTVNNQSNQ